MYAKADVCCVQSQPAFYALRPLIVVPKIPHKWELINWVTCLSFNYGIYTWLGSKSLVYLCCSTLLGSYRSVLLGALCLLHPSFLFDLFLDCCMLSRARVCVRVCVWTNQTGMGLHPMAGHFVAEHYTFVKHQETYSYYGPLNVFSYYVGYHNEHHDFPFIPGFRLPQLRAMAPEFYDTMPRHSSWAKVVWQYIVDPTVGPFSRVKRRTLSDSVRARVRAS